MSTSQSDPSSQRVQRWSKAASVITMLIGALVLLGWWRDSAVLKSLVPGFAPMKANTALAFLVGGLAVSVLHTPAPTAWQVLLRRVGMLLIVLLGALTLSEDLGGWNLGIDQILVRDLDGAGGSPGRMAPVTALNFMVLGSAYLLLDYAQRPHAAQILTLTALAFTLLTLIGYLYGVTPFYQLVSTTTAIALPTSIAFLLLGLALLCVRPDQAWMAVLTSAGPGGILARRLLPAALVVPPLLGWAQLLGSAAGLYESAFGMALFASANVIIFTALIARSATSLARIDQARLDAEGQLQRLSADLEARVAERTTQLLHVNGQLTHEVAERQQTEARFRALLEAAPEAMVIINHQGAIVLVNGQLESLFGYPRADLVGQSIDMLVPERLRHAHRDYRATYLVAPRPRAMGAGLELSGLQRNGTEFPIEVSLSPVATPEGGLVVAAIRDITMRKQAEAALRASEAKLRTLFAVLPVGISILDREQRIVETNPALAQMLALSPAAIATGTYLARTFLNPDGSPLPAESLPSRRAVAEQRPILDVEIGVVLETGKTVWTSVSAAPLPLEDLGAVVVTADVTDRIAAAAALKRANTLLTERVDQVARVNGFVDQLQACITVQEVYALTTTLARQLFPDLAGAIYIINPGDAWVETAATWGDSPPTEQLFGREECWALRRGQPHITGPGRPGIACPHMAAAAPPCAVCMPLLAQGETLGILHLRPDAPCTSRVFDAERLPVMRVVADSMALALANVRLRQTLHQQSIRDPLTHLFNRRYMEAALKREVARAARHDHAVAMVLLDVDHFKRINDTHGHDVGDSVLRHLGQVLNDHTRSEDIACRYGGEEFLLILPETTLDQAQLIADHLRREFKTRPIPGAAQLSAPVTLSCGVAAYPAHGMTGDAVVHAADAALYRAKREGRDRVVVAE